MFGSCYLRYLIISNLSIRLTMESNKDNQNDHVVKRSLLLENSPVLNLFCVEVATCSYYNKILLLDEHFTKRLTSRFSQSNGRPSALCACRSALQIPIALISLLHDHFRQSAAISARGSSSVQIELSLNCPSLDDGVFISLRPQAAHWKIPPCIGTAMWRVAALFSRDASSWGPGWDHVFCCVGHNSFWWHKNRWYKLDEK